MSEISGAKSIRDPATPCQLAQAIEAIRAGKWKEAVGKCRAATGDERTKRKQRLPVIYFSGTFQGGHPPKNDTLLRHSGLMALDFDGHEGDPDALRLADPVTRSALAADPHTLALFASASGTGLKVIVPVAATDGESHRACFQAAASWFKERHGLTIDPSGKDVRRACFVSYDPEAVLKDGAEPFAPAPASPAPAAAVAARLPAPGGEAVERRARAYLAKMPPAISGQHGHDALMAAAVALCVGFDLPPDAAGRLLLADFNPRCVPPWAEQEIMHKVADANRNDRDLERGWLLKEARANPAPRAPAASPRAPAGGMEIAKEYACAQAAQAPATPAAPTPEDREALARLAVWRGITDAEAWAAVRGTEWGRAGMAFANATNPPLPASVALTKAAVLMGAALSGQKPFIGEPPDEPGISRARLVINTGGGQPCNVYGLIVAEAGSGKDVGGLFGAVAYREGLALANGGSAEGLADALKDNGNGIIDVPEMADWLDKDRWQSKAVPFITAAFDKGFFHQSFSKRGGGDARKCEYCYPSIIANVQPGVLSASASAAHIESGFLSRFIFATWPGGHECDPANFDRDAATRPLREVVERCRRCAGRVEIPDGYSAELKRVFSDNPAVPAHLRPSARRLRNQYYPRFALLCSLMAGDTPAKETPVITADAWARAHVMTLWYYKNVEEALGTTFCTGSPRVDEYNRLVNAMYWQLRRLTAGESPRHPDGVTLTQLANHYRAGKGKERKEWLEELIERGQAVFDGKRYRAIVD